MRVTRNTLMGAACALVVAAGIGTGVAMGTGEDEGGATGPDADRARAAALALVPGGTATAVERDGEDGATWEVEVRRPDGSTVDVRLDGAYRLVVVEGDTEDEGAPGG